jgi:AAA+ ATPase superfamily predicted ATPase
MMHDLVLDESAPLYGRASEILKIGPLAPGWIRTALGKSGDDAVRDYAVWGGIPRYWESAKQFNCLKDAVTNLVFSKYGLFHQEPHRLLRDDMRSDVQPHSLLSVIAGGCNRLSEIAARLGKQAVSLAHPISLLIDLGYIKRDIPYGESIRSTKRTLYRLNDPFLLFWYRYVYPALSLLEQDVTVPVIDSWKQNFSYHLGEIWEELARRSVPHLLIGSVQWKEAYRWWGKGRDGASLEIDVVAESIDGKNILIGEAKWGENTNRESVAGKLFQHAQMLPFTQKATVIYAIWSPNFTPGSLDGCHQINAEQTLDALL